MYVCFHCHKNTEFSQIEFDYFDNIGTLQVHWQSNHASNKFQFFAIGMAVCFYCDRMDSFQRLQNHHQFQHKSEVFVVVDQLNRSKCALCQNILHRSEMVEHFKRDHSSLNGIFNAICFTQTEIEWLLKLDPTKNNEHSAELEGFVCGYCGNSIDAKTTTLKEHLENDSFLFGCCPKCSLVTKDVNQLIHYTEVTHSTTDARIRHKYEFKARLRRIFFRTKLSFSNGLVLFKHNVLKTYLDDRNDFFPFIERFAEKKFSEKNLSEKKVPEKMIPEKMIPEKIIPEKKSVECCNSTAEESKAVEPNTVFDSSLKMHLFYKLELSKQRSYKNNVCISGVSGMVDNISNLLSVFLDLCKAMQANIKTVDVKNIFQRNKLDLIVKLKDFEKKKEILSVWKEVQNTIPFHEKLNELMRTRPGLIFKNLSIDIDLTDYFRCLCNEAEKARIDNQILAYWITDLGLFVKIDLTTKEEIVWSKNGLMDLIRQKKLLVK